jgi:hypothetical protein
MNEATDNNAQRPFTVVVNGQARLEYDRRRILPAPQRAGLDQMDRRMDAGLRLAGTRIERPDALQRAQFVAIQLLTALQQDDEPMVAAACAYLADRLPDLQQLKARTAGEGFSMELVFDRPHVEEATVQFVPRRDA